MQPTLTGLGEMAPRVTDGRNGLISCFLFRYFHIWKGGQKKKGSTPSPFPTSYRPAVDHVRIMLSQIPV